MWQVSRRFLPWLGSALLATVLAGCAPSGLVSRPGAAAQDFSTGGLMVLSQSGAILQGRVTGPSAPASAYRVAGAELAPLARSIVYLTTPDERFYAGADGRPLAAFTDANGQFVMDQAPTNAPVFMTVLLAGNCRMVGFARTTRGINHADVDVATTYVAEFLRAQAIAQNKSPADLPLGELDSLVSLTRALVASGDLPVPSLDISATPALRETYAQVLGSRSHELSDAWARVLGRRPLALENLPCDIPPDNSPLSLTVDASGDIYVISSNDSSLSLHRRRPDGTVQTLMRDVLKYQHLSAPEGGFLVRPDGQLLWPDAEQQAIYLIDPAQAQGVVDGDTPPAFVDFSGWQDYYYPEDLVYDAAGRLYFTDTASDVVYRLEADDTATVVAGTGKSGFNGDGPMAATEMALNTPMGLSYGQRNGHDLLYVADSNNQRIREIDLTAGTAQTVVGSGTDVVSDHLRAGYEGSSGASDPLKARLNTPSKAVVDAQGRLFIADKGNRIVRVLADGKLSILAGVPPTGGFRVQTGDALSQRLGEVESVALDRDGGVLIADSQNGLRKIHLRFGL